MKDKTFEILLISLTLTFVLLTAAHLIADIIAYQHCSIIQFIAKELW